MKNFFTLKRDTTKLKVIFDMDDVLADFIPYVIPLLNSAYNKNFSLGDLTSWSLKTLYGADSHKVFGKVGISLDLLPKKDALLEFPQIYNNPNYDVWIVTATTPHEYINKLQWLTKYFPDFPLDKVIPCTRKNTVWADVLIDDGPHNLEAFEDIGEPVVYDMPYNTQWTHYVRVYSMKGISTYLNIKYHSMISKQKELLSNN